MVSTTLLTAKIFAEHSALYPGSSGRRRKRGIGQRRFIYGRDHPFDIQTCGGYCPAVANKEGDVLIANGVNTATGTRPYAGFSNITYNTTNGVSNYNALEVGVHRDFHTGLMVVANYQWSHAIDDGAVGGAEATTPEDQNCRSCERASSQFDMRSYFTSSAIWQVPVGKGHTFLRDANPVVNAILGGWQFAGVGTARSGLPLNVTISRSATALPDQINSSQRPNLVAGQSLYPADRMPSDWLNVAAFFCSGEWHLGQRGPRPGPCSGTLADGSRAVEKNARDGEDRIYIPRGSVQRPECGSAWQSGGQPVVEGSDGRRTADCAG
jgi:hypothetical protein